MRLECAERTTTNDQNTAMPAMYRSERSAVWHVEQPYFTPQSRMKDESHAVVVFRKLPCYVCQIVQRRLKAVVTQLRVTHEKKTESVAINVRHGQIITCCSGS